MKFLQKTKHLFGVIALVLCTACVALGMSFVTYSNAPSVYTATAAEGNVAKVGNTEYATIDEAIAAWTNNTTLTLLSDVTLSNVIKLSSTEKHILDLSTYTMTAASGKDAIQYVINGRSSAGYALDIKADATNPGGITATGATIVKHTKPLSGAPSKDRPITRFYGGVFNASYVVKQGGTFGAGYTGASAPYFQFYGGEYNGTIYTNRSQNQFHGGTFNGNMQMSVDTSAYTLVAGGTFKNLSNSMGSALNSDKFMIASKKEDSVEQFYDKEVYVDDNGYYVIAATEPAQGIEASVAMTPGPNDYLAYSKVAAEGQLNYTDINLAIQNNKTATITVYADEIDLEGIDNFTGTLVVPEGKTLTIKNAPEGLKTEGNVIIKGDKAKIGETGYATLQEAIEAATTGQTITLLEDITENVTINKNLEIDGLKADGTKFNYTGEIAFANQTVTIKNVNFVNGNINQNGSGTAGALTVEACTFTGKNANSKYGGYAIHVANFGNVVVINTDATDINLLYVRLSTLSITVTGGTIDFLDGWGAHIVPDCTVTFNGVTFKNLEVGVVVQNPGSAKYVVFTDCKFMDNTYPVVVWNKANNPVTFTFNGTNEMGSEDWIARIENNNYPFISGYEKAVVNGCQDGATIYGTHTEGEAVEENRVEATVTEEGSYDKVVYCSVCRKELSRETVTIAKIEATVRIGENYYATLAKAIAGATAGQTITLLADITENVTINKNLEIDGLKADGTKFNYTGEIAFANQTVTIKNVNFVNGNINQNGSGTAGALTVEACTFTGKNANSKYGGYAIHVANFGNVVVINTDATDINLLYVRLSTLSITVTGGTIDFLDGWGAHIVPDCTVTFNGVTFKNLEVGVVVQNPGSAKYVVFTDCKFMDNTYPVVVWNKANNPVTFTFNGTNEMGSEDWIARIENNNYPFISGYEKAVVNGCQDGATIYGTHTEGEAVEENRVEATVTEEGSYDKVVYCSVCRKELSRETVTIAKIEATVRIGENYYATLAKAIAGATAGQTITLLADITENVTVDKSLTIDGAEFAYTGTMTIINNVTVTIQNVNFVEGTVYTHKNTGKAKNITIQNCTFDGQGFAGYAMNLGGTNSILIENVEVENYYAVLQIPSATSSLCLKDVKIDNINYYGFKIDYAGQVAFDNVTIGENVAFAEGDSWVSGILDSNWGAKTYTITNCTFKNAVPIKVLKREDLINKTTFTFNGENEMSNLVAWDYAIYKLGSYGTTLTAPEGLKVEGSEDKAVVAEYENGMYVAKLHVMRAIKLESDFTICFAFPQVDGLGYVTVNGERFDTTWYTQGTNYVIEYTGIAAKEMAKELTFVVYDSEGNRVSDVMTTSIQSYLVQQLTKIGTGEVNALKTATRTLAVDALNYGAAAQVLFGYNTDALVNSGIEEYQQFASEARTYNSVKDKTSVQGVKINQTLTLENKVNVTFRFVVADSVALSENAKFTVVYTATGEEIPMDEGVEVIDNGNGEFYVYVTALSAKEADKAITCTLVDGGETLGTVTYSIESYAASKAGADDANGRTALAMMKYCDSAKKYFAVKK